LSRFDEREVLGQRIDEKDGRGSCAKILGPIPALATNPVCWLHPAGKLT